MGISLKRAMIGAAAAGTLTLAFAASGWSMHRGTEMARDPAQAAHKIVYRLNYTLDFSEPQEAAITDVLTGALGASAQTRQRLHELRGQLRALPSDYDAQLAGELTAEVGELTAELVLRKVSTQAEIYQLLSVEQRAEMDALLQKRQRQGFMQRRERGQF